MPDNYLSDFSPKDKPWDVNRSFADRVRDLYRGTDFERYAERIAQCSQLLEFALAAADDGELLFRLQSARFCRCRHCPICQWRRSLMWKARFLKALPKIQQEYPTARFIFLTLTVRNCPLTELRATVGEMNKAWVRLSQRKAFPAIGWAKAIEVTRGQDNPDHAHPHIHALLMVPAGYFGKSGGYLSQEKWTDLWQKSLRADYTPIVHVTAIKPQSGGDLGFAIKETFKYTVKPSDLAADAEWLAELTQQLHKTRAIALGGIFKQYLSEDEPEDLIHVDEETADTELISDDRFYFGWRELAKRYSHKKTESRNDADATT